MKPLLPVLLACLATFSAAQADSYCGALGVKDQLPVKYQKRGPFYSDRATGWIIGDDQLRADFTLNGEAKSLLSQIVSEFSIQGVTLAVMTAPPRPLFASAVVRSEMGVPSSYDGNAVVDAFSGYIAELNALGIKAPNLLPIALDNAADYYFQRDTHWTPFGAAVSAAALAEKFDNSPSASLAALLFTEDYAEKGSLSMVVKAACGVRPELETVKAPAYAKKGEASALLSDTNEPAIALIGASFSDRYQRDAYRVADAIAHFTGAQVDNMSVTGGGITGAMEAFIRSGDLTSGKYKTVVWEAPYTAPLSDVGALRQVLGALLSQRAQSAGTDTAEVSDSWVNIKPTFELVKGTAIEIHLTMQTTTKLG
jgi:alginate biosynthesis protein AlgX